MLDSDLLSFSVKPILNLTNNYTCKLKKFHTNLELIKMFNDNFEN